MTCIYSIPVKTARFTVPACLDSGVAVNGISTALFTKVNASDQYKSLDWSWRKHHLGVVTYPLI